MSSRTLLLSAAYEPISTISWQRALTLLTLGKVEVVEEYDHDIHSRFLVIKMPAVVRLVRMFRKNRQRVKFSRTNVLARDRWKCQYCGEKFPTEELTYDHVTPKSRGGKTRWENIVTACRDCNGRKANRTPKEAGMRLRRKPARPTWVPIFTVQLSGSAPEQWRDYLYWNSELSE